MKISLNWLKEYVHIPDDVSPQELALKLTMATAEIEDWETVGDDTVFDIDNKSLTHRPDLWGHWGFAREIAAVYHTELKKPFLEPLPEPQNMDSLQIHVENTDRCPRYNALVIDNVTIAASPLWLRQRLESVGARPINNVVDITNYILFELGQPLHAFDRHKLRGDQMMIRLAREGETITTLDDLERSLTPDMLLIADGERAAAIAGVMGGGDTEVDETTRTLVLESANFHPTHIRRTSAKLNLRSESSMRFEKGLDPLQTEQAARRFYTLLKMICPGIVLRSPLIDWDASYKELPVIDVSTEWMNCKLGTKLPSDAIVGILNSLAFKVQQEGSQLQVTVPSFRATGDIGIPEDLVEEVGRIYGYDNIVPVSPLLDIQPIRDQPHQILSRNIRRWMSENLGFSEVYNYAFVGDKLLEKLGESELEYLSLKNPLASDQNILRRSLVPNMLKITAENLRYRKHFRIYELDRVFFPVQQTGSLWEHERLALCGLLADQNWKSSEPTCFLETKGSLEVLLEGLQYEDIRYIPQLSELPPWAHAGRTATISIKGQPCGLVGQLHPQIAINMDIKATVGIFTLDISALLNIKQKGYQFQDVSRYPTVPFDISLICPEKTHVADVRALIEDVDPKRIKQVALFDIYTGENIGTGLKSLAFTVTFAAPDHTLGPEEIEQLQNDVITVLESAHYMVRKGS